MRSGARRSARRRPSQKGSVRRAEKPIATPGRMACAMASPIRLMRRSIRNTPIGARRAKAQTCRPARGGRTRIRRRRDQEIVEHAAHAGSATAQASACSSNASHMRRALPDSPAVSTSAVSPQATGSRASSSVCGKPRLHEVDVMQRREHRAALRCASAAPARAGRRWCLRRSR